METFKKIKYSFNYWYLRYLVATELYMVEPWEKVVIHIIIVGLFLLFGYMNLHIVRCHIDPRITNDPELSIL